MPRQVYPPNVSINKTFGSYIDKVGLEIEGGWVCEDGYRGGNLASDGQSVVFDRSVRFRRSRTQNNEDEHFVCGEINSVPLNNHSDINKFLGLYWPDKTNSTCGFHIHLSFKEEAYYDTLMNRDFYHLFKSRLPQIESKLKLGAITKNRIAGKNRYCKDEWHPTSQKRSDEKYNDYRYAMINFCWNIHRTMEVRVFSSHIAQEKSYGIVKWWVDLVNEYLTANIEVIKREKLEVKWETPISLERATSDEPDEQVIGGGNTTDNDRLRGYSRSVSVRPAVTRRTIDISQLINNYTSVLVNGDAPISADDAPMEDWTAEPGMLNRIPDNYNATLSPCEERELV